MPQQFIRATITYQRITGLPKDAQTNTLYFMGDFATASALAVAMEPGITTFIGNVDQDMSSTIFSTSASIEYFDLAEPEPRVPIRNTPVTLSLSASASLPTECSMVLSFQGLPLSGLPQARRRGRIFLPTMITTKAGTVSGRVEWGSGVLTTYGGYASALRSASSSAGGDWVVFSPTILGEGGSLAAATTPVVNGWVDNAIDTQRRRGTDPTQRTTWT